MNLLNLFILSLLIIIIDGLWLFIISKKFLNMVRIIQNEKSSVNMLAAGLAYLFIIIQIKIFLIDQNATLFHAFLLGITTYGIFDFTNLALFNKYNVRIALMDILWGGTLYTLVLLLYKVYVSYSSNKALKIDLFSK